MVCMVRLSTTLPVHKAYACNLFRMHTAGIVDLCSLQTAVPLPLLCLYHCLCHCHCCGDFGMSFNLQEL